MPQAVFDDNFDLLEEIESKEEDNEVLEELAEKRRKQHKSFTAVINKKKLSRYELDEVML